MTDYQDFTTRSTPKETRRRLNVGDVWSNSARCKKCGDVLRSKNRHHFVVCRCGSTMIDGGSWYLKRSGELTDMEEMSEMFYDV